MKTIAERKLTPEAKAKLWAELDEIYYAAMRPRPVKLVCDRGRVVADALVIVSPKDVNWRRSANGEIRVSRPRH